MRTDGRLSFDYPRGFEPKYMVDVDRITVSSGGIATLEQGELVLFEAYRGS